MKITVQFSIVMGVIFAVVCYTVAIKGFMSLDEIGDPAQLADARGFAWFYAFLGTIGAAFAAIGVWIVKTHR